MEKYIVKTPALLKAGLTVLLVPVVLLMAPEASAAKIAFLAVETSVESMGLHNRGAWESAATLGDVTLLLKGADGGFVDADGTARNLADFDVLWYHQGDAIQRTAFYSGEYLNAIRRFIESGGGVLLSGGALAIIDHLGLEPDVRAQRRDLDNFRDPAMLVPVEIAHPAFVDLQEDNGLIGISNGGCKAVADFYWGGPTNGMVLGDTPDGVQKPLVEYDLAKGRLILFGWRWPDYADMKNPWRANLLKLSANLLGYLATPSDWQPVVIRSKFPASTPDISSSRWRALRMAIEDLMLHYPETYPDGGNYLAQLDALRVEHDSVPVDAAPDAYASIVARFEAFQREALLKNPLLDFEKLLLIRRRADQLGLPLNFHGNTDLSPTGYDNTLVALDWSRPEDKMEMLFQPTDDRFIGDMDLHYDAEKVLLSIPDATGRWEIAELDLATGILESLPLIEDTDVHNYDACYLPDDRIVFTSTAPFIGVPCVGGRSQVANLYLWDQSRGLRRLTNDQDHNWCPEVLNNGRILYLRWEYADIAHAFTRLLFHANPDGSGQMEYYGSNSFWPTAMFYARPVPNHPTKVVTVVGGHHDAPRQGELVILDPALGRHEADGVVQRIPGWGETVEPVILDGLIASSWPRFLHPFPLSDTYFIVSCKPTPESLWGIYLVDVFDNFVLLHEEADWAMLEPVPWRKTDRQPVIPDVAVSDPQETLVQLMDVYRGPGLAGVPRGTVKSLRLIGYEYTFHGLGAEPDRVGLDGPWDVKRILGTVPVETDGSASFRVPALTPIAIQPLDADGKALALMRSWLTAVPGETLSCVGCHESQNTTGFTGAPPRAVRREPDPITPWHGPARGFSFDREVQPVLDAYCVTCHNENPLPDGTSTFDLTGRPAERVPSAFQMHFSPSYMELRRWVYTPTLESDAHLLPPLAYHADNSMLVQILRDDHYGVSLSKEAWSRLITWIDLNAPFHGTWQEVVASNPEKLAAAKHGAERRRALHQRYAGIDEDPEAMYPAAVLTPPVAPSLESFQAISFDEASVEATVESTGAEKVVTRIPIAEGIALELVRIEAGEFVTGSNSGYPNEGPAHTEKIEKAFLMGRFEVSNEQYRCFDPNHDSGLETGEAYQFGDDERGFTLNRPEQPVVRVSWEQAVAFCDFLSRETGLSFSLPTETQWEYACRADATTSFWYGGMDSDFSSYANLSDATHYTVNYPHVPTALPPWRPADTRFDDTWRVSAAVGSFMPNPWGLCDMHGNVAEWTLSDYEGGTHKVVRGGSWMSPPKRARSSFRLHYDATQAVHDVGFRVSCEVQ